MQCKIITIPKNHEKIDVLVNNKNVYDMSITFTTSQLLLYFGKLYNKQHGPRSDCSAEQSDLGPYCLHAS